MNILFDDEHRFIMGFRLHSFRCRTEECLKASPLKGLHPDRHGASSSHIKTKSLKNRHQRKRSGRCCFTACFAPQRLHLMRIPPVSGADDEELFQQ